MRAALISMFLLLASRSAAELAVLREVRPIVDSGHTRLVFDTSRRVEYSLREMPGDARAGVPPRLFVELQSTRLGPALRSGLTPLGGPLRRLRAAELPGGVTRVVLDVPGLSAHRAFPMVDPFRLVVDVEGDPRPVAALVSARPALPSPFEKGGSRGISPVVAAKNPPLPPFFKGGDQKDQKASRETTTRELPAAAPPRRKLRIVLDPGHGGKDPGAIGAGGVAEKDIVLDVCSALAETLRASGFEVLLTRDRDVFLSLGERTARANAAHADLFVSVHANASEDRAASGIETYYLSNTNEHATVRLAAMENQLSAMTGERPLDSDVSWIVSDMIQSYKVDESRQLAAHLQTAVVGAARRRVPEVRDLGSKPGPFFVLVGAGMPAVLVEIGFVTHAEEGRRIAEAPYQGALAAGLVYGIGRFVGEAAVAATL